MASFATPEELIVYLNLGDNTEPMDRPTLVLGIVSAAIRDVCEWAAADPVPVPAGIKGVCLRYAAPLYAGPAGVRSQQIDDYAVTYLSTALRHDPDLLPHRPVVLA
jgi:hypothetical protein